MGWVFVERINKKKNKNSFKIQHVGVCFKLESKEKFEPIHIL